MAETGAPIFGPTDRWLHSTEGESDRRLIDMLQYVGDLSHTHDVAPDYRTLRGCGDDRRPTSRFSTNSAEKSAVGGYRVIDALFGAHIRNQRKISPLSRPITQSSRNARRQSTLVHLGSIEPEMTI